MPGEIARATGRSSPAVPAPPAVPAARTPVQQAAVHYEHSLQARLAYAHQLAEADLLPRAYQRKPGNILFALDYGQALGISPIAVMMGIHVIEGRPTASAGLIQALVRQAGHRLRVTGDGKSATCTIWRSDDPDYPFEVTFTWEDAVKAGVTGKSVWKQYPAAMLKARATTSCARDACQEVLFGLIYTPEELGADVADGELPENIDPPAPQAAADGTSDRPEGRASKERERALVEAFRAIGLRDISAIIDAIRTIIGPVRDEPMSGQPDLTNAECDFIEEELNGITSLEELERYLSSESAEDDQLNGDEA